MQVSGWQVQTVEERQNIHALHVFPQGSNLPYPPRPERIPDALTFKTYSLLFLVCICELRFVNFLCLSFDAKDAG